MAGAGQEGAMEKEGTALTARVAALSYDTHWSPAARIMDLVRGRGT